VRSADAQVNQGEIMPTKNNTISLNKLPVEQARGNFHLLLLANPNYFGNLKDSEFEPVLSINGDTSFEEIGCVGFSDALSRLEAVVSIKQSSGYGGGLCTAGSQEYVRFYLSFDGGTSWLDQGVTAFNAHDISGSKPLEYSVAQPISVAEDFCFYENLPQVRAILSWNFEPPANTPNWIPVWGNVVNVTIQIPAFEFIILSGLLEKAKIQLPAQFKNAVDLKQPIPAAPKKALSLAEIASSYKGKPVTPARYLYSEIKKNSQNLTAIAASAVASSAKSAKKFSNFPIEINISDVIASILATSGDTTYEELDCVGLDPNRDTLVGVVKVKLPYGFNGGLCTAGSEEYVAFWVDWGSGYEYAGTVAQNVHDISGVPAGGLEYAVVLPIDVASHQKPCSSGPQIVKVRAILSWQTAPPATDPNYVPVWGNRSDALVEIPAGEPYVTGTANISIIGGIGVDQIDTVFTGMTNPFAVFALTGTNADPWIASRQCPFGGQIVIQGLPSVGNRYRVWVQKVGSPLPTALTDAIITTDMYGTPTSRTPDGSGFFPYLDNSQNIDDILAYWYSAGDDQWRVWLEIADGSDTVLGSTPHYLIQLDNTAPSAEIHIDSSGDCKQFTPGTIITGHFVAQDAHFGVFGLSTLPTSLSPNEPTTTTPSTSETAASPGDVWQLNTSNMTTCGYVVDLEVWDNSIVGSGPGGHNGNTMQVGFCLVSGS
jgi:hypothetical protein